MTITTNDYAYGSAANIFGSDPETPEEHDILAGLWSAADASHHPAALVAPLEQG